jgi:hypothetical protein
MVAGVAMALVQEILMKSNDSDSIAQNGKSPAISNSDLRLTGSQAKVL